MVKILYPVEYKGEVYSLNQACKEANIAIPSLAKARKNHPDKTVQQIFDRAVTNSKAQFANKIPVNAGDYLTDGNIVYKVVLSTVADLVLVSMNGVVYIDRTKKSDLEIMNKNLASTQFKNQMLNVLEY